SVIIVAPFTRERGSAGFRGWLHDKCQRPAQVHYFVTDERVREARLRARNHPRDRAKFLDYGAYRRLASAEARPAYEHLWFDTTERFPELSDLTQL
ncbi:MAG TPA: hypothetical protein VEQ59_12310, partial [Polyangiaceae bacterium]|nr:hypothetical protein [Polyangiaceae bacterium]